MMNNKQSNPLRSLRHRRFSGAVAATGAGALALAVVPVLLDISPTILAPAVFALAGILLAGVALQGRRADSASFVYRPGSKVA
ncbi:MAG: hypothetical protein JJT96_12460 [Opitutales bacterium]|nr:hypothetical protein [Opitutales bacterium]